MGGADRILLLIAREAARLMSEDGVREYRDAKRKAAHRFGPAKGLALGNRLPYPPPPKPQGGLFARNPEYLFFWPLICAEKA